MGNFLTSTKEAAASSLYDMSMSGKMPQGWANILQQSGDLAKTNVMRQGAETNATTTADTISQVASMGGAPTGATADILGRNKAKVGGKTQEMITGIDTEMLNKKMGILDMLLGAGFANLKTSSPFADVLAGLSTAATIGAGTLTGLGPQGLGLIGKARPPVDLNKLSDLLYQST